MQNVYGKQENKHIIPCAGKNKAGGIFMQLLQFKKNVGTLDMIIRIVLGALLITLGAFRVFPGRYSGTAIAVLLGALLMIEGAARY